MLIELKIEVLEAIVKDGIKEMMNHAAGRQEKKRAWFAAVKAVIVKYQRRVQEEFLPILVNDFGKAIEVKFSGGKMKEEEIEKVKLFMTMVEKSNIKRLKQELLDSLDDLKLEEEKLKSVKTVLKDGHEWIFQRIELYVRKAVMETLFNKSVERSKIEVMLYNFVDGEVPETVKKLLETGMNSVPSTRMTKEEIDKRVENALLEYVMRLGKRRIHGNAVVQAGDVKDWIKRVKIFNMDEESKLFVGKLEDFYPAMMQELSLLYEDVKVDTKEELIAKLEKEGCVLVNCDKNMGMSLFRLDTMRKADEDLMKQLGAVEMYSNFSDIKEEVIKSVKREIQVFLRGLNQQQLDYMNSTVESRTVSKEKVSFPFLKCQHKVHKMSEEEIKNKDLSALKFRPVVDAKQWLTKDFSGIVMQMLRDLNSKLLESCGPVLGEMKSKDGWRFAAGIREFSTEEEYSAMLTADIEEAYTNITDGLIKKAIDVVGKFVEYEEWKIELMKKLVDLVLDNNYAETSGGIFKFKRVLPMGYKMSGDALDLVALAGEMVELYHLGADEDDMQKRRVKLAELKDYPEMLVENNVQRELKMSRGVKVFKRYVDDTHAQVAGTKEEILNSLLAVGYMYPDNLVISMKLNIWQSEFLDVLMWKNLFSETISTVMKRGSDVPVGHIRKGSNHPEKYKLQSLMGEMLRGRRLASDVELIDHSDERIGLEFESIGYSRREVLNSMEDAKKKFEEKYSGVFVKIPDEDEGRKFFSYGGGLIHNKNYRYGEVLLNFIDRIKPAGEPGILLLPDLKVKNLAFTKKRYLSRQEEDKKRTKS